MAGPMNRIPRKYMQRRNAILRDVLRYGSPRAIDAWNHLPSRLREGNNPKRTARRLIKRSKGRWDVYTTMLVKPRKQQTTIWYERPSRRWEV